MSAILLRLQSVIGEPLSQKGGIYPTWKFSKELAKKKGKFFHPLVTDHPILNMRYTVMCMRLAQAFAHKKTEGENYTEEEARAFTNQVVDALAMAELLTKIYEDFLHVPREVERLKNDQAVYRTVLSMQNIQFPQKSSSQISKVSLTPTPSEDPVQDWLSNIGQRIWVVLTISLSQKIRQYTALLNFPRLTAVRARRLLVSLVPVIKELLVRSAPQIEKAVKIYLKIIDPYIGAVFNYLAWIFFLPRLLVNLFLLFKHLYPGSWMSEEEKKLAFIVRLQAQLQRRWFELFNDVPWFINGLLGCFVFVGALAPVGSYISIVLFFYDVILPAVRAYIELNRINKLIKEYEEIAESLRNSKTLAPGELAEVECYQDHLQQSYLFERKRLLLPILSTFLLFVGMLFTIPAITLPIYPFIGAIILLSVTVLTYFAGKWVENQRPSTNLENLVEKGRLCFSKSRNSFFKPLNEDSDSGTMNENINTSIQESLEFSSSDEEGEERLGVM